MAPMMYRLFTCPASLSAVRPVSAAARGRFRSDDSVLPRAWRVRASVYSQCDGRHTPHPPRSTSPTPPTDRAWTRPRWRPPRSTPSVEGVAWRAVDPAGAAPGGELAFIDGAQQVEAWLTITADGDPEPLPGAAFAVAAGAVLAGAGPAGRDRGPVGAPRGPHGRRPAGWSCRPRAGSPGSRARAPRARPTGIARRVGEFRQQMELALAERLAAPGPPGRARRAPLVPARRGRARWSARSRATTACTCRSRRRARWSRSGSGSARRCSPSARTACRWYQRLPGVGCAGWAGHPARRGRPLGGRRRGRPPGRPRHRRAAPLRRPPPPRPARAAEPLADRRARGADCATAWATAAWRCARCGARRWRPGSTRRPPSLVAVADVDMVAA